MSNKTSHIQDITMEESSYGLKTIRTKRVGVESLMPGSQGMDKLEEPLSPRSLLFHQPKSTLFVIAVMGVKGKINPDEVKAEAIRTWVKHPRFSSLQVVDEKKGKEMKWVPTKVDLDKHIIVPNIDPNMDSPDKFVEDYVSNLGTTTIDMSRPLWDVHILNVKTSHAEAVGVFRCHHSLGDGMSLMSLLLASSRKVSNPEALPTLPVVKKSNSVKFKGFWEIFWLVWNTIIDLLMFGMTILFLKDTKTPITTPSDVGPTPWRFVHRTVSLDDVKYVKNAMNVTINDVVMGVAQAGLSQYMNRKYGNSKKCEGKSEKKNDNLPKNILLRASLIINLRPSAGICELAEMMKMGTKVKWGNKISFVLLPFNIALREDPLDYVRNAKAAIDRKKHSVEAKCIIYLNTLIFKIFGVKVAGYLYHRAASHASMCFSNVMGPLEEIRLLGNELAFLVSGVYGLPHALTIHFQSYANKMSFGLTLDERVILDPYQLCDDLEESLMLIKNAVIAKGEPKENGISQV